MRISDWSSDVCSSDLQDQQPGKYPRQRPRRRLRPVLGPHPVAQPDIGDELADEEDAERLPELLRHQIAGKEHPLDARAMVDLVRLDDLRDHRRGRRSEEHPSELQSLMRITYAVFCLKKK